MEKKKILATLDFTVMTVFLKWPISAACPSEVDLGAVGGWLQLFQQSLSQAIITNDSVSGRKLSP